MSSDQRAEMSGPEALPMPATLGAPWARITPARWGFWIEHGTGLTVVCCGPGEGRSGVIWPKGSVGWWNEKVQACDLVLSTCEPMEARRG